MRKVEFKWAFGKYAAPPEIMVLEKRVGDGEFVVGALMAQPYEAAEFCLLVEAGFLEDGDMDILFRLDQIQTRRTEHSGDVALEDFVRGGAHGPEVRR